MGKFAAKRGDAGFEILRGGGEFLGGHALDSRLGRCCECVVAGKMGLPHAGHFPQFFFGLPLQGFLDFIDASNRRSNAAHFALVLAADDFLENPLDHVTLGVRR